MYFLLLNMAGQFEANMYRHSVLLSGRVDLKLVWLAIELCCTILIPFRLLALVIGPPSASEAAWSSVATKAKAFSSPGATWLTGAWLVVAGLDG